jgi:hypothetical protein
VLMRVLNSKRVEFVWHFYCSPVLSSCALNVFRLPERSGSEGPSAQPAPAGSRMPSGAISRGPGAAAPPGMTPPPPRASPRSN